MSDALDQERITEAREAHAHGPTDGLYVRVFAFLVVVTAMEVGTTYVHAFKRTHVEIPILIVLMALKFFTVTYFFMHLRYDPPTCRRVFNFGLGLAVSVFIIALAMFHFWAPHYR